MNNYQITRQAFLEENGFTNTPSARLAYDKLKQDSLKNEDIVASLKKQGF